MLLPVILFAIKLLAQVNIFINRIGFVNYLSKSAKILYSITKNKEALRDHSVMNSTISAV